MGSCGFMAPKIEDACAQVLPGALSAYLLICIPLPGVSGVEQVKRVEQFYRLTKRTKIAE